MNMRIHEEQVDLSTIPFMIGRVIGKGGVHIKRIQAQTSTTIAIDPETAIALVRGPMPALVRAARCSLEIQRLYLEREQAGLDVGERSPERVRLEATRDVHLLQARDASVRNRAMEHLVYTLKAPPALEDEAMADLRMELREHLVAALESPDPHIVAGALEALGRLRDQESVGSILPFLQETDIQVRAAAVGALGLLRISEAGEAAEELLSADDLRIRLTGLKAVGRTRRQQAAPTVVLLLEEELARKPEPSRVVVNEAVDALILLEDSKAVPVLMRVAREVVGCRSRAVRAMMALDAEATAPALVDLLADPGVSLQRAVLGLIRRANYRPALPAVRATLERGGDAKVRMAALELLAEWEDVESVESARRMAFHEPSPLHRHKAVPALAALAGESGKADLERLQSDTNPKVRNAARKVLRIESPRPRLGLRTMIAAALRRLAAGLA